MLSETTLGFLSTLTYRADAKRLICWLPLSGIYWDDEMPAIRQLIRLPEDDRKQILRLFGIRQRLWKGEALADVEQQFWDETYLRVPHWAFFQRQQISADDNRVQEDAERSAEDAWKTLLADADEVSVSEEDGVQSISATFNLTKTGDLPKKQSWWGRVFRKGRVPEI
jgi:hypothetical protein